MEDTFSNESDKPAELLSQGKFDIVYISS